MGINMKQKYAIIRFHTYKNYDSSDDSYSLPQASVNAVTEWQELDNDTLQLLKRGIMLLNEKSVAASSGFRYHLVEQLLADELFISATIEGYRKHAEKLLEQAEKRKAEAQRKKEERAKKKAEQAVLAKDALVKDLKRKIEELEKKGVVS